MKPEEIIRAWKDEAYRRSLSEAERAMLPENPAGLIELADAQLGDDTAGGARKGALSTHYIICGTAICPTNFTCSGTLCEPIKW